jgi:transcriptional regulator with XRE-family HTH domain
MGTGRSYISKLESGRVVPSLQTLQRATSALSIDLAELFLRVRRQTQAESLATMPDHGQRFRAQPTSIACPARQASKNERSNL